MELTGNHKYDINDKAYVFYADECRECIISRFEITITKRQSTLRAITGFMGKLEIVQKVEYHVDFIQQTPVWGIFGEDELFATKRELVNYLIDREPKKDYGFVIWQNIK